MELKGKRALVTGAAVRVGREIALTLAAKGADVVIHYRSSAAEAESAANEVRAKGGVIVNIADWSGFRPYRDFMPYCASKGGLITLTKSLARDFAPKVRANAVAPGPVMPPADLSAEERDAVSGSTLVGRWGSPR